MQARSRSEIQVKSTLIFTFVPAPTVIDDTILSVLLSVEQYLNDTVAHEIYNRFGCGLRVHIEAVER